MHSLHVVQVSVLKLSVQKMPHKCLLPCPCSVFAQTPFEAPPTLESIHLPLVKQHLFTSRHTLPSSPILLNRGSVGYSRSSTVAIKICVNPHLHRRRCYGATYRVSSSEHGRGPEFGHHDTKSH